MAKRKWIAIKAGEKPVDVVDPETGEVLYRSAPIVRVPMIKEQPFVKIFSDALKKDFNLTKAQGKVLNWILTHMDRENLIYIDQKSLAKELDIAYQTVRKAILALKKANLVKKEGPHIYRVNPSFAAKVTAEDRVALVRVWE